MFLNMRSAILQTISSANFINIGFNNPLKAGKAFANQPQYWKDFMELMNSDYLVDRRNGLKMNISESEIADDPAQHKQSHVLQLLDAGDWTGNVVALPNNRVRVTHPAWFATGEGAPDFKPSQHIHYSKSDLDYTLDVNRVFDNLYNED